MDSTLEVMQSTQTAGETDGNGPRSSFRLPRHALCSLHVLLTAEPCRMSATRALHQRCGACHHGPAHLGAQNFIGRVVIAKPSGLAERLVTRSSGYEWPNDQPDRPKVLLIGVRRYGILQKTEHGDLAAKLVVRTTVDP